MHAHENFQLTIKFSIAIISYFFAYKSFPLQDYGSRLLQLPNEADCKLYTEYHINTVKHRRLNKDHVLIHAAQVDLRLPRLATRLAFGMYVASVIRTIAICAS